MSVPGDMTLPELQRLVGESKGEWEHVEFKKSTGELQAAMQTLCGFLNGSGGRVFLGVTDGGRIVGQDVSDATFQEVANAIRKLEPPARVTQTRVTVQDGREVLILQVEADPDAPCTFDGRAYRRIGNTTSLMPREEYARRLGARLTAQAIWENQDAGGYPVTELDMPELDRTLRDAVSQGRLESEPGGADQALDRLNLRVDGRLRRAAVVLFGKRLMPDFPQCGLRMARFRGTTKTEFLDQRQLHGHAFRLLEEATTFLSRHIPVAGRIEPGKLERTDTPLYPPLALREALVNAICHRDYTIPGGAVNVAIYDDRLEIISSGLLPPGIRVEDLKRDHLSRPRNPLIAEVFYRRGLIERWGRGTQKIVELCLAAGRPEPEFEEPAGAVTVRFLPSGYHPPLRVSHNLTERQRRIPLLLSDGKTYALPDVFKTFPDPLPERTIRPDLPLLRDLELVESLGRGRSARWSLKRPSDEGA